jgi:hypothetical protein
MREINIEMHLIAKDREAAGQERLEETAAIQRAARCDVSLPSNVLG